MNSYDVGDVVTLSGEFSNSAGTFGDPGEIKFKLRKPNGTTIVYTYPTDVALVKDSTGKFHVDYLIENRGIHWYRFEGNNSQQAAAEERFYVRPSAF